MLVNVYDAIPNSNTIDRSRLCNYLGHLEEDELDSLVAITGCLMGDVPDDKIHITLLSKHSPIHKSFSLDKTGKTYHVDAQSANELKDTMEWMQQQDDSVGNEKWEKASSKVSAAELSAVPPILTLNIRMGYDKSAKQQFEKDGVNADNWLASLMTHAQVHFLDRTLRHKIILQVKY